MARRANGEGTIRKRSDGRYEGGIMTQLQKSRGVFTEKLKKK
ncbi:MAG: hypothetical protein ACI4A5_04905 [Hominilimicola sp.]